jgi:hypothetical protein
MKRIAIAAFLLTALGTPAGAYSNGYLYSRTITVAASVVPSTQTNFPMLVSGTYPYLATAANGGQVMNTTALNGQTVPADLIFTSDAAGANLLNWEVASYTVATGQIEAWVQVPALSNGAVIYMWYANASVTTYQSTAAAAWDATFTAVYHMSQNPNGAAPQMLDSTANGLSLTTFAGGSATLSTVACKIGNCLYTASPNQYQIANAASALSSSIDIYPNLPWTMSGWFMFPGFNSYDDPNQPLLFANGPNGNWGIFITSGTNEIQGVADSNTTVTTTNTAPVSSNTWYHLDFTYDGSSTVALYQNGALVGSVSGFVNGTSGSNTLYLNGNQRGAPAYFDEIHASNSLRSAGWIETEFNNQNDPSDFYIIGAAMLTGPGLKMTAVIM